MQNDQTPPVADGASNRDTLRTIAAAIADGHVGRAKAIYQQSTGHGPAEAEAFVAQLTEKLRAKYPERFAPGEARQTSVEETRPAPSFFDRVKPWHWAAVGIAVAVAVIGIATMIILDTIEKTKLRVSSAVSGRADAESALKAQRDRTAAEAALKGERKAVEERQATQREREAQRVKAEQERVRLASLAVDTEWNRLPPGFVGNDPRSIYESLSKRLLGIRYKDEFETEAQHQQKIADAMRAPIIGSLDINSRFAFMVKDSLSYDAEKGEFRHLFGEWRDCNLATIDFKRGDSYIGENAFGVQKEIDVYSSEVLELNPVGAENFERISFTMPADVAREAERQIRFLLIGKIRPPYLHTDTKEYTPTIDSPRKCSETTHTIPLDLEEIWVVRIDNGQIIKRFKPWVPKPDESLQRVAKNLERASLTEDIKAVVRNGNPTSATLSFTKTLDGTYTLTYHWINNGWVLKAGTFNKRTYDNTVKRITLRPEYGSSEDEQVPWDVKRAFDDAYRPPR